jgi:hypothetical protein
MRVKAEVEHFPIRQPRRSSKPPGAKTPTQTYPGRRKAKGAQTQIQIQIHRRRGRRLPFSAPVARARVRPHHPPTPAARRATPRHCTTPGPSRARSLLTGDHPSRQRARQPSPVWTRTTRGGAGAACVRRVRVAVCPWRVCAAGRERGGCGFACLLLRAGERGEQEGDQVPNCPVGIYLFDTR